MYKQIDKQMYLIYKHTFYNISHNIYYYKPFMDIAYPNKFILGLHLIKLVYGPEILKDTFHLI